MVKLKQLEVYIRGMSYTQENFTPKPCSLQSTLLAEF